MFKLRRTFLTIFFDHLLEIWIDFKAAIILALIRQHGTAIIAHQSESRIRRRDAITGKRQWLIFNKSKIRPEDNIAD